MSVIQLIGFAASALVVISLTSSSMYRLRVIGLFGAVTFILYGVLSQAWPVVATNCATLSLHVLHLRRVVAERAHDRADSPAGSRSARVAFDV